MRWLLDSGAPKLCYHAQRPGTLIAPLAGTVDQQGVGLEVNLDMSNDRVQAWHQLVNDRNVAGLDDVLADDAVFHSPIVHSPQEGKQITKLYLMAAFGVLSSGPFRYVREVASGNDAVLEFVTEVDGIVVNGVDMIRWNDEGKIVDFKVMIRPLQAINLLHQLMAKMLQKTKAD
jgi:hypothetical protein